MRQPGRGPLAGLTVARRGVVIYVVAGLVFIVADALTKVLVHDAPIVDVVFGRHLSAMFAVLLVAGRGRPGRLLRARRPGVQLVRGVLMFGTTVLFFSALSLLPLGTVSALSNTNPLFVLFLAGPFLGERPTRPALVGALIGFGGTLAITGLGTTALDPRMLAPLAFALVYALFSMLTRVLREDDSDVTVFWSAVVCLALAIVLVIVIPVDQPPTALQWLGIGLLGLMALTGHWLLVEAYRWGRASDLAPLGYLGILWSFLVGTAVFGEPITVVAAGGAIAIAVGGIVALRSAPEAEGVDVVPPFDRGDPAETA